MRAPFAVLDFPASASRPNGGSLLFENPLRVIRADELNDVASAISEMEIETQRGRHAVGFVSYEAAPAFDAAHEVRESRRFPLVWFGIFVEAKPLPLSTSALGGAAQWRERTDESQYSEAIDEIRAAIGRGDVYQVNYTVRLDVDQSGDVGMLYRRLMLAQGPGYAARIHTGEFEIVSASPELFFDRTGDQIVTRPMKGTARRGRWRAEDDARAAALAASEKERAENVMIVDLIRNDLGRVALTGTVRATELFAVERRPTVLQMTSTVRATLADGTTTRDIFTALFPCGSVTGAPKIAATQIIADLEDSPRGVYCGAIGHVAPSGDATFSVGIRTLTIDHATNSAEYGVGSGITWDSAQASEYDEVIAKAGILTADLPSFELLETMRLENGVYARLERHLARLSESAAYFGFDAQRIARAASDALTAHARASSNSGVQRVRLRVSPSAHAIVEATDYIATDGVQRIALAATPVKKQNRFLYHKTTHRAVYDRHRGERPNVFDVLLWNEEHELTEFTIGNVVVELDGTRYTPPRECGLMAGTFRDDLIARAEIHERVLTSADLPRASALWLVNSVREWVAVTL